MALVGTTVALLATALLFVRAFDRVGRSDLMAIDVEALPILATLASATAVGAVLAHRRPDHPVGWLFLALGASVAASGPLDGYALYGAVARPGSLPAADLVAVVADGMFVVWFGLVAWILHLTPTGTTLSPRWRLVAVGSTVGMMAWFAVTLVWPEPLDAPYETVTSPLALGSAATPALRLTRTALGIVSGVGLVLAGVSLLVRFRRSGGVERRQLLWLAVVVVPLPAFVVLAYYASPDHPLLLAIAVGGFMGLLPVATGLAIARYHLYDVDRILGRAVAYLLASAVLAITFALVVTAAGLAIRGGSSDVPVVLGTLGAVAVAIPAYRAFQEAIDRRFHRRRYEAHRQVEAYLRNPDPDRTIEDVLSDALEDPTLSAAYWVEDRDGWVTADGRPADPDDDDLEDGVLEVRRDGRPVARIRHHADPELARSVADAATPELENVMLRARIRLQLVEVDQSRARIAAAQLAERRRLERNLHDGAQQRLLALAFELRAAQVNGSAERLEAAVAASIEGLQAAVVDLRELANGLHPTVLQDGGITAAAEDLAHRFPIELTLAGVDRRFRPEVEATAWFLACEAVANAIKHGAAQSVALAVTADDTELTVRVTDDGRGGADPGGNGLRGLADRAEAVGGTLTVRSAPGAGTTVIGVLPCAP
ncbi:sensor histidine kinase [Nocardioides speluncae]|uniref:sensor histidine kinase n=1 Tax=Nocardioides speluncae TaxID=2670337 RepID=UPI0012B1638B|nr:histidine kinase [Nocardioides speluncae]